MKYWMVKTEPEAYSWSTFVKEGRTAWTGVRNFQARNMLRDQMKKGDQVFLYYSSTDVPGIVGVMEVTKEGSTTTGVLEATLMQEAARMDRASRMGSNFFIDSTARRSYFQQRIKQSVHSSKPFVTTNDLASPTLMNPWW